MLFSEICVTLRLSNMQKMLLKIFTLLLVTGFSVGRVLLDEPLVDSVTLNLLKEYTKSICNQTELNRGYLLNEDKGFYVCRNPTFCVWTWLLHGEDSMFYELKPTEEEDKYVVYIPKYNSFIHDFTRGRMVRDQSSAQRLTLDGTKCLLGDNLLYFIRFDSY